MNTLKTLFVVGILAAVGYGVYVAITTNPRLGAATAGGDDWTQNPGAALPDPGQAPPSLRPGAVPGDLLGEPLPPDPQPGMPDGFPSSGPGTPAPGDFATPPPPPGTLFDSPAPPAAEVPMVGQTPGNPAPLVPAPPPAGDVRPEFANLITAVRESLQEERLVEALETMSRFYGAPNLTATEARQLNELLDQVAGTVIYDRHVHLLEPAHAVQPGEDLGRIAEFYQVPWQMLANINGISDPAAIRPGDQLKVVRGPVDAVLFRGGYELALMLQGKYYAGRFRVGTGPDLPADGDYAVKEKYPAAPGGGGYYIALDAQRSVYGGAPSGIHSASDPSQLGCTIPRGSICMADDDLRNVHAILSVGSRVKIVR